MTKIINLLVAILLFLLSWAILFPTEKANLGFYQSRSYMISQVEPMVPEGRPLVPEPNPVMPKGEPLVPERESLIPEDEPFVPEPDQLIPEREPIPPENW